MSERMVWWLAVLAAYLVGGIPFGYLVGRMRGVDVRTVGSKNIGATNVFRTVGKKWGLLAFFLDVSKGLLPVLLVKAWGGGGAHLPLAVGVASVLGHMLTPYMRFRGGKGVATAFGMLIGLVPGLVGVAFAIFAVVFACSHYISLGSCLASAFLIIAVWFPAFGAAGTGALPVRILVSFIAAFIIFKHRSNIGRLLKGTESRIYLFGKPGRPQ